MRFLFAFAVLVAVAVAVSARVYPAKAGAKGSSGHSKGGSDGNGTGKSDDDRFHLQSDDGQYVFGHTTGNQGRAEIRAKDGTVTGYYSYADGNGQVVYVNYVADKNGYRVLSNAGVPSASVTIEGGNEKKGSGSEKDFQKVFADFTNRIKDKVVQQTGQKVVDIISEGQKQVTVDPIVYSINDTETPKHEEPFADWNQIKMFTTQKPTTDGRIDRDEGQQPQENVDPNWGTVVRTTTQRSNIKGHDNDGQEFTDDNWIHSITTTETASKIIHTVPNQPQVPTKGGYSDIVVPRDDDKEISTEVANSRIAGTESTIINNAEKYSPVTKPVSVINDVQTTVSYYDRTGQVVEDVQTINTGVKQFEESSTVVFSESATEHYHVIKKNDENNIKFPTEADVLTTIKPLDEESFENVPMTTGMSTSGNNFQTTDIVPNVVDDRKIQENVQVISTSPAAPVYEPDFMTTSQPDDTVTITVAAATGIQYVTEDNKDLVEFRTLGPNERIGTTISPDFGQADVQEQEINWPEIPQEPIPQVLVPLDPYPENWRTKNAGIKTKSTNSRLVRQNNLLNVPTTTESIHNVNNKSVTSFNFPTYYLIG